MATKAWIFELNTIKVSQGTFPPFSTIKCTRESWSDFNDMSQYTNCAELCHHTYPRDKALNVRVRTGQNIDHDSYESHTGDTPTCWQVISIRKWRRRILPVKLGISPQFLFSRFYASSIPSFGPLQPALFNFLSLLLRPVHFIFRSFWP